ncbi:MAG TPA: arabinosyltransferase domain-containing protein [Pseudonocardiaceae bacterium]|nr:arabinosyltransferase domain-containing protein [Pseudonocardiaceae bacterium]
MRCREGVLAGLAALTLLSAVGVLLAPVTAEDPVVGWPRAGEQPRSTVLALAPYRPARLDATVPCTTLAALDRRAAGGDALRTVPQPHPRAPSPGGPAGADQGLVVAVARGIVVITASGQTLLQEPLPTAGCHYRIVADAGGVRVLRDGTQHAAAGVAVPQVGELATAAAGTAAADGLAVVLHPDARYESTPTALKTGLLVLQAAALLALLVLAWRWWGGQRVALQWPRPQAADAVLVAVSAVWVLLSPVNFDDPWYLLMARGATESGSISNAIYMFNVTENPFVASQYVLQLWGALGGWGLAWMRLVPLGYGLLTWLLLRLLLVTGFGRQLGSTRAVCALLVAYLLWWLPYGMTLRPEPLIVLLAAAVLLLAELARRRRSVGVLAAATVPAAAALTVSPSGLVAAAPLVLALPWLWTWLRGQGQLARVAAVGVLAAAGTALVLVGFADATLGDVLESIAVHQTYYQTFSWYEEIVHYQTVLTLPDSSQWARRAPVVLTVAVLIVVAVGSGRQSGTVGSGRGPDSDGDPVWHLLLGSAVGSAIALGLLALTPTKWVNHFGAVAAVGTVLLAAALLRSPLGRGAGGIAATAGAALLVGAVSLSFAGPNFWRPYSDRGQPFGDHLAAADQVAAVGDRAELTGLRPALGPVPLASPVLWTAVALGVAGWAWWWRRRGREPALSAERGVLLTGSVALVVLTLVVFVWAPLRQYPGWTVAVSAASALRGEPCALANYVQVLVDTPAQPVPAAGPARVEGSFAAAADRPAPVPAPAAGSLVWHDAVAPGGPETGLLVTPWFVLPAGREATHLLVPLLGARDDQRLALEYATAPGADPPVAGSIALPVDSSVPDEQWQQAAVALDQLGGQRPSAVRLVVADQVTGPESWLAVGQPRLAVPRPLTALTAGRPVYADQLTATLLPCVPQVHVEHGIAQPAQVRVLADENFSRGFLDLAFDPSKGGTQVQADRNATTVRVPSWLSPAGPPTLPWGRVEQVLYDHPVGLVDLRVDQVRRPGWTRLPTLTDPGYAP